MGFARIATCRSGVKTSNDSCSIGGYARRSQDSERTATSSPHGRESVMCMGGGSPPPPPPPPATPSTDNAEAISPGPAKRTKALAAAGAWRHGPDRRSRRVRLFQARRRHGSRFVILINGVIAMCMSGTQNMNMGAGQPSGGNLYAPYAPSAQPPDTADNTSTGDEAKAWTTQRSRTTRRGETHARVCL